MADVDSENYRKLMELDVNAINAAWMESSGMQ